jgi:DNA polymerase-1
MSKPRLVLVDGSSYLYRAFHALPPLSTSKGEPTGAVHGVLNMLNKLLREQAGDHIAIVFDAPGRTFRDEMFEEYKAHRPPMPDDLRAQIQPVLDAVPAMGLPLLRIDGVEADDVIGTLSRRAVEQGFDVLISTGDKDMAQLVDDHVTIVNTMTGTVLDRNGVKEKFDVFPEQIVDYLALVGDSSDNIPGVPRVGAKTAAKWLNEFGTAEAIVANAAQISGKVGESLRENLDQLQLSRQLATILQDVELPMEPKDLKVAKADLAALKSLYTQYELKSLLRTLPAGSDIPVESAPPPVSSEKGRFDTVLTKSAFDKWQSRMRKADLVAIDTETNSLNYMQAELVGISVAVTPGEAAYIPLAHDYPGAPAQLDRAGVLQSLRDFLEDPKYRKLGHHLKYDAHIFARYGITLRGMQFDSMLESYVLNSVATRHDMDSTAAHYLGIQTIHYEDVAGKGAKQITFNQVALDDAAAYSAEDADVTLRLHQHLWSELEKIPALRKLYETIEQPLVPVLLAMEETGVLIDRKMLKKQSGELAEKMLELEKRAHDLAGGPFNLGSPKQLQEILFDKLGLPVVRKTPTGQPSTAEDVLQDLAADYELPEVILDYRGVAKLKSTYTDKLPMQIDPDTGRVHTSYHQAVAATGRLSSTDPNLQNIPIPGGPAHTPSLCCAARPRTACRRLFPDRTQDHGSPVGGCGIAESVCRRTGCAPRDSSRSIRPGTGSGNGGPAAFGQGNQLRPDVRHVGFRPGQAARYQPWRSTAVRRSLFRALSWRQEIHG